MFGRYRRQVPKHHQRLIWRRRIRKPNWYVGAAEHPAVPRDPALVADIERVKERLRNHTGAGSSSGATGTPGAPLPGSRPRAV